MTKTILVADDSKTIQHVVNLTFQTTNFRVVPALSVDEAMKALQQERPDVVLADVTMPGTDGYALCDALKRNSETSGIPVLLLAGAFEPFDERRAVAARADGHLRKPFDSQALIDRVKTLTGMPTEAPAPMSFAAALQAKHDKPAEPRMGGAAQPRSSSALAAPPATPFARPEPAPLAPPPPPPPPPPQLARSPMASPFDEGPTVSGDGFEDDSVSGGGLPVGPTLEPPPAPDARARAEAASVDMWSLADDGAAAAAAPAPEAEPEPVREPVAESTWANFDDGETQSADDGVESIEEIDIEDLPPAESDDVEAVEAEPSAPPIAAAPVAEAGFQDASWSQPSGQAWSEPEERADDENVVEERAHDHGVELEPLAAAAQTSTAGWGAERAVEAPAASHDEQGWVEHHQGWAAEDQRDGQSAYGAEAMEVEPHGRLAEMVVQTAESVAHAAHAAVPGLPREELVQMAREVIERIAWEVVPELAETIIQAEIQRLLKRN
jgi:CheY-like chemotaxis protein